ncbi:alkaline phosphatase D family protein [Croceicoccus bisphenolivorans]|uniref:alkaline phosphatase D family protein n=1 Tax=Croceicoccus bisphenolivorans TaxID=1783232 RepID=UPI000AD760F7|nr:alkaline phosphatase D family protein [Croceicoccus bisphenolivorans]
MMALHRRNFLVSASGAVLFAGLGRHARLWAAPRFGAFPFSLGVASGDPWPDGFVIWTRLAPHPLQPDAGMPPLAVQVRWEVAEDEAFAHVVRSGEEIAHPDLAHSIHVEVSGLRPSRLYWYRFLVTGVEASPVGRARTAPAADALPERLRLGLAGCQAYPQGWYEAWRHLASEPDLDAVFHYGDYIYEYGRKSSFTIRDREGRDAHRRHLTDEVYTLPEYRQRYAQYKMDPDLQAAHHAVPFIMSFDDHEVDNNWVSSFDQHGSSREAVLARRIVAMQAWYEHMPVRLAQAPRLGELTMYRRLDFGRLVRMHVLDTRSHRSQQLCETPAGRGCRKRDDATSTVLGNAQEAWLGAGLRNQACWNLIAQQVRMMPIVRRNADGIRLPGPPDSWSGYPAARARLIEAVRDNGLTNVVVASGDSHVHNVGHLPVRDDELDGPAAAVEFLGTSISSGGDGQADSEKRRFLLRDNPHFSLYNQQRGYQLFDIGPHEWRTDVKVLDRVQTPGSMLSTLASYRVHPDKAQLC